MALHNRQKCGERAEAIPFCLLDIIEALGDKVTSYFSLSILLSNSIF